MIKQEGKIYPNPSEKKKNCYACKNKTVVLVKDYVDIENPSITFDIMENKEQNYKPFFYESPDNISVCNFCSSHSNKKDQRKDDSYTSHKNIYSKHSS